MTLQNGDFVRIHFTGSTADGIVFDTTKQEVAKESGLEGRNVTFEPATICVGEGFVLDGIDEALVSHKVGDSFTVTLAPEKAFGRKRSDLLKLMPLKVFKKQGIKPVPGLDMNIDGMHGTVKSITGNRVIVDFNNPLSGQTLTYEIDVVEKVDSVEQQVASLAGRALRFEPKVAVKEDTATIELPVELPKEFMGELEELITRLTSVKKLEVKVNTPSKS